jgi:uroporphyrinogen decarboxylase
MNDNDGSDLMTSRERVLAAVNFREPDRVPIDLGGTRASGINAVVYDRLKRRMGLATPTKVHDPMQILAELEPEVLDRLGADVVPLEAATARWARQEANEGLRRRLFEGTTVFFPPRTNLAEEPDGSWTLRRSDGEPYARMPENGYYFDFIRTTMSGRRIDPNAFRPSRTVPEEELRLTEQRARDLYENTDKAILGWGAAISLFGMSWLLADNITQGSLDDWLCMLMAEKGSANEMMGRAADAAISCLKLYHQAVGDRAFAWGIASDDGGTQRGELLRPELFVEMILPHYRRVCDWVHANTKWKTFLHSCGSIYHYIPHWIEAGVDILNPVQISAANMEPARLKREFGGKVVFWGGGCDTQKVLPLGTAGDVREHVRRNLEVFAPGGGFVFTQVHNIQQDVPVENVEAMFAAAREFGAYR